CYVHDLAYVIRVVITISHHFFFVICYLYFIDHVGWQVAGSHSGVIAKIVLPSTMIRFTGLPFTVILPSLSTITPGNFLSRSCTNAFGNVLHADALNSIVSFLITTGGLSATTNTSSSERVLVVMYILPMSIVDWSFVMTNSFR